MSSIGEMTIMPASVFPVAADYLITATASSTLFSSTIVAIVRLGEYRIFIVPVTLADLNVSFSLFPMPLDS